MPLHISTLTPLRPLRMNPPTPSYSSKHYYLAFSGNIGEALGPLSRPYKASPRQNESKLPDWKVLPNTLTIFGSSRQRSTSPELEQEKEVSLSKKKETLNEAYVSLNTPSQKVTSTYSSCRSDAQTLAKLCNLPPIFKPPQKPLPPLPSNRAQIEKPACHVAWISPATTPAALLVESPSSEHIPRTTDSILKQVETQSPVTAASSESAPHLFKPSICAATKDIITCTILSSSPSTTRSIQPPASPDSPLFRLATKRTPATYENAVRIAAGSTFRHSISSFHGGSHNQHDNDAEYDIDCSCLSLQSGLKWLKSKLSTRDLYDTRTRSKSKQSTTPTNSHKQHSLTKKQRRHSKPSHPHIVTNKHVAQPNPSTASCRHSKRWAEEYLEWQTNVTTRFASEGRWLPIGARTSLRSHAAKTRTFTSTPNRSRSHMSKTSTMLHARAASTRTNPLKRNRTSAYAFMGVEGLAAVDEQSSLLRDVDRIAQMQTQWGKSGNKAGVGEMETEYVIEKWKARRRSEYRGVERTEMLGWKGVARAGVL